MATSVTCGDLNSRRTVNGVSNASCMPIPNRVQLLNRMRPWDRLVSNYPHRTAFGRDRQRQYRLRLEFLLLWIFTLKWMLV
jgi:hypothetical protein